MLFLADIDRKHLDFDGGSGHLDWTPAANSSPGAWPCSAPLGPVAAEDPLTTGQVSHHCCQIAASIVTAFCTNCGLPILHDSHVAVRGRPQLTYQSIQIPVLMQGIEQLKSQVLSAGLRDAAPVL